MKIRQRRGGATLALLGAGVTLGALLSAGCGSSTSDPTARIRTVNLSTDAGTAGILVNGGANGGDQGFGETTSYNFIGQGVSTFGYSTSPALTATGTAAFSPALRLNNGSFYTAYLIGRRDLPLLSDVRFLQTVVIGNKGAAANYLSGASYADPPSDQANVRILNGAPDAGYDGTTPGAVDVLINGKPAFTNVAYPAFPKPVNATDTSAPATIPATTYHAYPSGAISVQVNAAGTSTVLVPPTDVSVSSGKAYTLVVTEPTIEPTYSLYTAAD